MNESAAPSAALPLQLDSLLGGFGGGVRLPLPPPRSLLALAPPHSLVAGSLTRSPTHGSRTLEVVAPDEFASTGNEDR